MIKKKKKSTAFGSNKVVLSRSWNFTGQVHSPASIRALTLERADVPLSWRTHMGMWWCWHGHQHLQCPQQEWTKQLDKMTWGALSSGSPCGWESWLSMAKPGANYSCWQISCVITVWNKTPLGSPFSLESAITGLFFVRKESCHQKELHLVSLVSLFFMNLHNIFKMRSIGQQFHNVGYYLCHGKYIP